MPDSDLHTTDISVDVGVHSCKEPSTFMPDSDLFNTSAKL